MAGILGAGAALLGGANALFGPGGMFGSGSGSSGNISNVNLPQYGSTVPGVQANYLNSTANTPFTNIGQTTIPLAEASAIGGIFNNPQSGRYMTGAGVGADLGQGAAVNQFGAGQRLYDMGGALGTAASPFISAGTNMLPSAQTIMNLGLDPQSALYNRTAGQVQNQTGANLANSGVLNSPYGQNVLGNTMANFNIDWQNNQLARAVQGAQGAQTVGSTASGLTGTGQNLATAGGNLITGGANLQGGAPNLYASSSGLPYNTQQYIQGNMLGGLDTLQRLAGGAQGLYNAPNANYMAYLQAANNASNPLLAQSQGAFSQGQTQQQNLGNALYLAGNGWGGGGYTGWPGGSGAQPIQMNQGQIPQGWQPGIF